MEPVIYDRIEDCIIQRLKTGLGRMVRDVVSYSGEMDNDPGLIVAALPAAWVTFGGIKGSRAHDTSNKKWLATGTFAVMVGQQNVRNDRAARKSGRVDDIGANSLVFAVRRLLMQQDFADSGLSISALRPGRVRTLFNTRVQKQAFSVFACEFETDWIETVIPNGEWPQPGESKQDEVFGLYVGETDPVYPPLKQVSTHIETDPPTVDSVADDMIELGKSQ